MPFAVLAAVAMVADWVAVARGWQRVEWVAKPVATGALLVCAVLLEPSGWFVAALALCLAGDVFLMLPRDLFVPGLVSFLLGHLAYIVGFWTLELSAGGMVVGAVVVAAALAVLAPRLLAAAPGELKLPVAVYMGVIGAMAITASGTGEAWAIVGAFTFMASDSILAWNKFVRPLAWAPVAIMVTYHLAQAALVLSLA